MSKIKKKPKPTESELKILNVLWSHGPCSVRFVNEQLNLSREVGYTTTLKLMQIMVDKGLAVRDTESRSHIYEPAVEEKKVKNLLLKQFVDSTFKGSAMRMVMQAIGDHNPSKEELEEIKALIKKIENQEP